MTVRAPEPRPLLPTPPGWLLGARLGDDGSRRFAATVRTRGALNRLLPAGERALTLRTNLPPSRLEAETDLDLPRLFTWTLGVSDRDGFWVGTLFVLPAPHAHPEPGLFPLPEIVSDLDPARKSRGTGWVQMQVGDLARDLSRARIIGWHLTENAVDAYDDDPTSPWNRAKYLRGLR